MSSITQNIDGFKEKVGRDAEDGSDISNAKSLRKKRLNNVQKAEITELVRQSLHHGHPVEAIAITMEIKEEFVRKIFVDEVSAGNTFSPTKYRVCKSGCSLKSLGKLLDCEYVKVESYDDGFMIVPFTGYSETDEK